MNHFTIPFVTARQQRYTGELLLYATLSPTHLGCCWEAIVALLIFDHFKHVNTWCLSVPISVLACLECLFTSSPVSVCLWFPCLWFCICCWLVNCKQMGLKHPNFYSYITLFQLFFSLCHLISGILGQKNTPWNGLTSHCSLPTSPSFVLNILLKAWVGSFYLYFSVNFGVTSTFWFGILQTAACCSFDIFVGFLHEPMSTTDTSNYNIFRLTIETMWIG